MRVWKRITSCTVVFAMVAFAAVAGQAPREGGRAGAGMSPEERAKLAKAAAPLAAKAVAQHLKLSAEETKKFTAAYVKESEAAQKRMAKARESDDREQRMAVSRENAKRMQEVLESNLKPEQAKKAAAILGRFSSLDREIQNLLRAKVEQAKVEKALAVLVKYAVAQQELFTKMQDGSIAREDIRGKVTELREKTAKELAPIIGEDAAGAWQKTRMRGMRGAGGGGRRGGNQ